jgi:DNA-binding PadR family transcriptional regulator
LRSLDVAKLVVPSPLETLILKTLNEKGESYGFALMRGSGGKLKRGTIYVTLDRMVEKDLLVSRDEQPTHETRRTYRGIRRKLYRLSPLGERTLKGLLAMEEIVDGGAGESPAAPRKPKRR